MRNEWRTVNKDIDINGSRIRKKLTAESSSIVNSWPGLRLVPGAGEEMDTIWANAIGRRHSAVEKLNFIFE